MLIGQVDRALMFCSEIIDRQGRLVVGEEPRGDSDLNLESVLRGTPRPPNKRWSVKENRKVVKIEDDDTYAGVSYRSGTRQNASQESNSDTKPVELPAVQTTATVTSSDDASCFSGSNLVQAENEEFSPSLTISEATPATVDSGTPPSQLVPRERVPEYRPANKRTKFVAFDDFMKDQEAAELVLNKRTPSCRQGPRSKNSIDLSRNSGSELGDDRGSGVVQIPLRNIKLWPKNVFPIKFLMCNTHFGKVVSITRHSTKENELLRIEFARSSSANEYYMYLRSSRCSWLKSFRSVTLKQETTRSQLQDEESRVLIV